MLELKYPVREYTTPNPVTIGPNDPLPTARDLMTEREIRHLPVLEDGKAIGILSIRDVEVLRLHPNFDQLNVAQVMTRQPFAVKESTPLIHVAFQLSSRKIGSAIVEDREGHLVGIFTLTDALNALVEFIRGDFYEDPDQTPLEAGGAPT